MGRLAWRMGLGCGRIRRRSPDRKRTRGAILLWRLLSLLLRDAVCRLRILSISGLQWRISGLLWQLCRLLWPLPPVLWLAPGILLLVGDEARRDDGGLTVVIVLDRKCYRTCRGIRGIAPWDNCACQPYCFVSCTRSSVDPRHRARIHDERPRFSHPSRGRFPFQMANSGPTLGSDTAVVCIF